MKLVVVDACVVMKLYFEEKHSDEAEWLFQQGMSLLAPSIIWPECANVIWKQHRNGDLSEKNAFAIAEEMLSLPLRLHDSVDLLSDGLKVAMQFDRAVYDSLYVALAVKTDAVMVTADKRLVNALAGGPLEKYVMWLGDVNLGT